MPSLEGFLSDDSSDGLTDSFDLNLQAVSSMLNSPFLDMRAEALSILLSLATEASFISSLSQLTHLDAWSSPNYLTCVQTLTKMILPPTGPQTSPHSMNIVSLALGGLAHLSQHSPTAVPSPLHPSSLASPSILAVPFPTKRIDRLYPNSLPSPSLSIPMPGASGSFESAGVSRAAAAIAQSRRSVKEGCVPILVV
jgi:hypothetical protein